MTLGRYPLSICCTRGTPLKSVEPTNPESITAFQGLWYKFGSILDCSDKTTDQATCSVWSTSEGSLVLACVVGVRYLLLFITLKPRVE